MHQLHSDADRKFSVRRFVEAVKKPSFFHSLPVRLGILMSIMICLPVMVLAYLVETQGREALLQEKSAKLFGVARSLDHALDDLFTLSEEEKQTLSRAEQLDMLHRRVMASAEGMAGIYPGLGVGFYSRKLDAIVAYAPNNLYGWAVGHSIAADHPGRQVMETNEPLIAFGSQVRGDIMNAMVPIVRADEVIGYIWANELFDDVRHQMDSLHRGVMIVMAAGLFISLILVVLLSWRFGRNVNSVKSGLQKLQYDLSATLPPLKGEIGEIAHSANTMARALREARSLNESILDSIDEAVITVDNDGAVTMLNPAARKTTGFVPEETLYRKYEDLFVEHEWFRSLLLDTLRNGTPHVDVEEEYPVNGRVLNVNVSTSLIRNSDGESIGAAAFLRDVTSQKDMQRHMERAEQLAALGELVAGMAHELRNPLTAIRGFVQYLQQGASEPERQEYTAIILKEVDSINKVISELLSFARPAPKNYYKVRIGELVENALILVRTREVSARIDFVSLIAPDLPDIEADGELIKQVLLNLLLNAVQSIAGHGRITISIDAVGDVVTIAIRDSGCGFEAENKEKIFAPFFTTKVTGTGLGLSIVQRIVSAHHGRISINSVVDKGTDVILELPIHHVPAVALIGTRQDHKADLAYAV